MIFQQDQQQNSYEELMGISTGSTINRYFKKINNKTVNEELNDIPTGSTTKIYEELIDISTGSITKEL
jgi:ribose 5-phosphate isomerase